MSDSRPNAIPDLSSTQHLQHGQAALNSAIKQSSRKDLYQAILHFETVHERQPANVVAQEGLYRTLFMRDLLDADGASDRIKTLYRSLDPILQKSYNPPSYIAYVQGKDKYSEQELTDLLHTALRENPAGASMWFELSRRYEQKENAWLALAAAQRAQTLLPDDADYLYQLGDTISYISEQQACTWDEREYLNRAAKLKSRAAAKSPNFYYHAGAGQEYLRLGLFPIALRELKKSQELKTNRFAEASLIKVYTQMEQWDKAEELASQHISTLEDESMNETMAMIKMAQGQLTEAADHMRLYRSTWDNILVELRTRWVLDLTNSAPAQVDLASLSAESGWESTIRRYMRDDSEALLNLATNGCEKTEAHFYSAYRAWQQGNNLLARDHLQKVLRQSATEYSEHMWARVFLNSVLK